MKLLHYIKGDRFGKNARDIEIESLRDPFLADALDGYNRNPSRGNNHIKSIAEFEKEVIQRSFYQKNSWLVWIGISLLLVCFSAAVYLWIFRNESVDQPPVENEYTQENVYEESNRDIIFVNEGLSEDVLDKSNNEIQWMETTDNNENSKFDGNKYENNISELVSDTGNISDKSISPENDIIFHVLPSTDSEKNYSGKEYISKPMVGIKKFNEYLHRAKSNPGDGLKGEIIVSFRVNKYGRPSVIRIEESFSTEAGQEAIRLISGGPEWEPTDERVKVSVKF